MSLVRDTIHATPQLRLNACSEATTGVRGEPDRAGQGKTTDGGKDWSHDTCLPATAGALSQQFTESVSLDFATGAAGPVRFEQT